MFSSGIFIRNSDEHSIFDKATGERINPAKDITISDRVWLSEGVTVAKGVTIAPDCVVGARSYVGKSLQTPNAIYAGTPAKLVRENVVWHRRLLEKLDIA